MLAKRTAAFLGIFIILSSIIIGPQTNRVSAASTLFCELNSILYGGCIDVCSSDSISNIASGKEITTGDGGGCGGTKEQNQEQIWNFLRSKGLSEEAAAGIMGNMEQESGFMPTADNSKTIGFTDNSGKGCRGIVQWCHERNTGLDSFAAERGKDWDCLGVQLEYLWYEMTETDQGNRNGNGDTLEIPLADALNGADFSRKSNYTGSGAANAATIFHDYFERSNTAKGEHLGRADRAEEIYTDFTGKAPESVGTESSSTTNCVGANTYTGGIPSEECVALIEQYRSLVAAGKITYYGEGNRAFVEKDLQNCTTNQIECGTVGMGGVNPRILRATVAAAANSGASTLQQWNFNSGHACDGLNHPRGMAIDIYCPGNDPNGQGASADCNSLYMYFYNNYSELGLTELIWQWPPDPNHCNEAKVSCTIAGHRDHIHIGTQVQ